MATDSARRDDRDDDGSPATAGWLLVADHRVLDIDPMIEATGQVYRYPVADAARAAKMEPGQPCFLLRVDSSKVIGLWAVGEVVGASAPLAEGSEGAGDGDGAPRWAAELELLPLEKAIARKTLLEHKMLAASALAEAAFADSPIPLLRREVRAFETFDFFLVDPREDQLDALDRILAEEDATD